MGVNAHTRTKRFGSFAYLLGVQGTDDSLVELKTFIGLGIRLLIIVGGGLALDQLGDGGLEVELALLVVLLVIILIHGILELLASGSQLELAGLLLVAGTTVDLLIIFGILILVVLPVLVIIVLALEVETRGSAHKLQGSTGALVGVETVLVLGSLIGVNGSHADTELSQTVRNRNTMGSMAVISATDHGRELRNGGDQSTIGGDAQGVDSNGRNTGHLDKRLYRCEQDNNSKEKGRRKIRPKNGWSRNDARERKKDRLPGKAW